jgi:hypothetical protein
MLLLATSAFAAAPLAKGPPSGGAVVRSAALPGVPAVLGAGGVAAGGPGARGIVAERAPAFRPGNELERAFSAASAEFGVPQPILMAIGFEATHWNPDAETRWGGYGMFDLREGDQDPSIEHAGDLLSVDPNLLMTDWRLNLRGAAAILADQARTANGGRLPDVNDLPAWWDAVRAFSGREEPFLQQLYAEGIYDVVSRGAFLDTEWGEVGLEPRAVDISGRVVPPPPSSTDSSVAVGFTAASSSNYSDYSRGAGDIDMVVIHTTEGSYSGTISWFQNSSAQASAHYVVRSSDGQVTQMVHEADVAWHAGNWDYNLRSVGVEHEGYTSDCSYYTNALYAGSAALVADVASREGVSLDRSHIIGHSEVPDPYNPGEYGGAGHHTDPGGCWDWDYYMGLLNGETGNDSGEIIGAVADSDIYNGTRLVGATVWIAETGASTTVGSDGYYRFDDVPFGTYTMHASYSGYAEGTCTKTTSSSQDWCSIALYPQATEPTDTGSGEDTDTQTDSGGTEDTDAGGPSGGPADDRPGRGELPGETVRMDEVGGGGCATAPGGAAWVVVGGVGAMLVGRRRK